jgi:O-antigen/teichoic acid export membrane protein
VLVVLVLARLLYVYQSQFTNVLSAIDRPEITLRVNAAFVATNLGLNLGLVAAFGWLGAAVATATSAGVGLVLSYGYLRRYVTVPIPAGELASQATAAVVMGVAVYATRQYAGAGIAWTFGLVAVGGVVYFAVLAGLSRRFRATIERNLPAVR